MQVSSSPRSAYTSEITIAVNGGVGVFRFVRSIPFPARNTRTRISHTPFLATIMQRDRDRCGSTCCATTLSSLFAPSVEQLITTKSKDTRQGRRVLCWTLRRVLASATRFRSILYPRPSRHFSLFFSPPVFVLFFSPSIRVFYRPRKRKNKKKKKKKKKKKEEEEKSRK